LDSPESSRGELNTDEVLRCTTEATSSAVVLHIHGEVDLFTADQFGRCLVDAERLKRNIIVDLSQAAYFDLNGVRTLEEALARLALRGQRLAVTGSRPSVHAVLTMFLSSKLPTFDLPADAIEFFSEIR
jgi:anti-anti-sigma factor